MSSGDALWHFFGCDCALFFGKKKKGESWFEPENNAIGITTTSGTETSPVHSKGSQRTSSPLDDIEDGQESSDILIEEYEDCLRRFEVLESDLLARGESDVLLRKIREDPDSFVGEVKENKEEMNKLIDEAKHLRVLEEQMHGIRVHIGEGERVDSWTRDQEPSEGEDDKTVRSSNSVGRSLVNKLKKIDATQGTLSLPKRASPSLATAQFEGPEELPLPSKSDSTSPPAENKVKLSPRYVLHVKPKWPEWLVDENYEVIKVSKFGIRYNRNLKLTQYHILSSSEIKGVTKVYTYLDIVDIRVTVESHREEERITLVFKSHDNHYDVYNYITPMAAIIANQITTRVKIRRVLGASRDKRLESEQELELVSGVADLDPKASERILKSITSANTKSKTSAVLSFAESLVENFVPSTNETNIKGDRSSIRSPHTDRPRSRQSESSGSATQPKKNGTDSNAAMTDGMSDSNPLHEEATAEMDEGKEDIALNMMIIKRNSPEFYVQQAVERVLHKGGSAEHDTRAQFLEHIREAVNQMELHMHSDGCQGADGLLREMRMFIEGLHEYLLLKRGQSLATIHVWGSQLQESPISSPATGDGAQAEGTFNDNIPPASLSHSSSFSSIGGSNRRPSVLTPDKISAHDLDRILDRHLQHAQLNKVEEGADANEFLILSHLRYKTLLIISYIAYLVVEESIFAELKPHVMLLIDSADDIHSRDKALTTKIKATLSKRSQEDWGIPESNCSPLGWAVAINELNTLDTHNTPSTKLGAIVVAAKNIFAEYTTVKGPDAEAIGADDLVPIFVYILAQTNLDNIFATCNLLWKLCHPSLLHGESGYYLTVFESAASYLEGYREDQEA